jgi:catechol 2,3-dioxygenase-like lactoylglutathione lyase family enzyme
MINRITHISLLVRDQEEALKWYTEKLGFEIRADNPLPGDGGGRWLTMGPKGQPDLEIVLEPVEWGLSSADAETKKQMIGKVPGWVITTEDCHKEYELLKSRGVKFVEPPEEAPWGISAVLEDLYRHQHNLLQPTGFVE